MQDALGLRRLPEQQFKWEVPVNRRPQRSRKEPAGSGAAQRSARWGAGGRAGILREGEGDPPGAPEQRCGRAQRARGDPSDHGSISPDASCQGGGRFPGGTEAPLQRRRGLWEGLQGPGIGQASEMWEQNDCRARATLPSCARGGGADHTNVWCHSCLREESAAMAGVPDPHMNLGV